MAALCPAPDPEEEEEGSEYSYEYETDSEYEYEEEAKAEVSCSIMVPPPPCPPPPVVRDPGPASCGQEETALSDEEFRKHREQLEKFKPKLPAYVITPEPCAFSEDPSRWIGWMEEEVNREKEKRFKELQAVEEEEERKEKELQAAIEEEERKEKERIDEEDRRQKKEEEERLQRDRDEEEARLAKDMKEAEEELEKAAAEEEERLRQLKENEIMDTSVSPDPEKDDKAGTEINEVAPHEGDGGSEWEYESEDEAEANGEADNALSADITDISQNEFENIIATGDNEVDVKSDEINVTTAVKEDEGDIDQDNGANVSQEGADQDETKKKAAIHGQSAGRVGETPDPRHHNPPVLDGSLDPETQRKLDFIRKKKAEARRGQTATNPDNAENRKELPANPIDCLDEDTRAKLDFIRKKKASAPSTPGQEVLEGGKAPGFTRQQSCPERPNRPSSMVAGNNESLDDMLARIKILRAERKQILQDMSAIKNAFDGPSTKEDGSGDDGIDSAGDCTPVLEHGAPFQGQGPSPASLSRQGRRSIDSGIGSKSMCSAADGSPTAELESIHEGSEGHGGGRKKISHEDREEGEVNFFCFICGENLGRLSKGAVFHMGLEDGDPLCQDALYLTDESKEKIRNIASTRMFTHEAKYRLLETVDLEIYDIDYGIPAEDVMDKVDAFLIDVEKQKQLDKEKFDAMRSGAIDEILMEEFKDILDPSSNAEDMETEDTPVTLRPKFVFSEATQALLEGRPPPPPPRTSSHSAPPPPPPPPPSSTEEAPTNMPAIPSPPPALSGVLNSIKSGQIPQLRHAETQDSSEEVVGQVIHRHIAPRAFTKDMRCLVKDIRGDQKKKLKKVKTVDKSKPFIPEDMEIYFYGGNNCDKKAPPPPLSKQPVNSSKKRGGKEAGANTGMENAVTPVYLAAQEGHLDVLKYLVTESGGDLYARAQDGMAPIHAAAQMGCLPCLKWMVLEQGVDLNIRDGDEATPLHFAASRGHAETVRWLLRRGARIAHDKFGKTPMNDAAENEQLEVVSLLVQASGPESSRSREEEEDCSCTSAGSASKALRDGGEPFYLHAPSSERQPSRRGEDESSEEADHQYEAIKDTAPRAPPPPPLPPPDLLTPAPPRRVVERQNSSESMASMIGKELADIDGNGDLHVLKPSELTKGRKRKNIRRDEAAGAPAEGEELLLQPKPGAHMVLPFIPPKFPTMKKEGDSLIKPSEYLRSLTTRGSSSLPRGPSGIPDFGQYSDSESQSSSESGIDSPGSSLPSSGVSPGLPSPGAVLPAIREDEDGPRAAPPPPPPPPPAPGPPPPPPPPHPPLKASQSAPASAPSEAGKTAPPSAPQAAMAISMKELTSVKLRSRPTSKQAVERTHSLDPNFTILSGSAAKKAGASFDSGDTKGDLIAELKLSHTIGGVGKLRSEQAKAHEELEREQYRKFLSQFTAENFLNKIPEQDPAGGEIPRWKREMLAKKAAEKAKQESLDERARLEEERRQATVPAWKKQLIAQKSEEEKKRDAKQRLEREKQRKKKLIMKL